MRQHPSAILAGIASAVGVLLLLILTLPLGTDSRAVRASTPAVATRSTVTGPRTASPSGATYPIVIDADGQVAGRYSALALPVHFWVDREGIVREWAFGELPADHLKGTARRIVAP